MKKNNTKTTSQYSIPGKLWKLLKKQLPKEPKKKGRGRPRVKNRDVMEGIWYVLWTGCQWKSIRKEWFNVSSSVLHERFQTWQEQGIFEKLFKRIVRYYARERKIGWKWQSIDSMMSPAPLGGAKTGKNPTDRSKLGSKIHILVDERGAPLAVWITGANQHDKWSADDLIVHIVIKRPNSEQHFCGDKGYDFEDVREFVGLMRYIEHIKHRRKRGEPEDECPIPGEKTYPARRWVVERTLGWLAKRRSIATRWCKKPQNWLAFVHMACAQVVLNLIFG
ncbi:MAG: IS5 family transposase [Methanosarcinaceae archaeon]